MSWELLGKIWVALLILSVLVYGYYSARVTQKGE